MLSVADPGDSSHKASQAEERDGSLCSICMEHLESEGDHRLASLACGHLFGKACIERWITGKGKRSSLCPQCHQPCKLSHIRVLYSKYIRPLNTREKQEFERSLADERERLLEAERRLQVLTMENHILKSDILSLQRQILAGGPQRDASIPLEHPPGVISAGCLLLHQDYVLIGTKEAKIVKYSLITQQTAIITTPHNGPIRFIKVLRYHDTQVIVTVGPDLVAILNLGSGNLVSGSLLPDPVQSVDILYDKEQQIHILSFMTEQERYLSFDLFNSVWGEPVSPRLLHKSAIHSLVLHRSGIVTASRRNIYYQDLSSDFSYSVQERIFSHPVSCTFFAPVLNSAGLFIGMFRRFPLSVHPKTVFAVLKIESQEPTVIYQAELTSTLSKCFAMKHQDDIYLIFVNDLSIQMLSLSSDKLTDLSRASESVMDIHLDPGSPCRLLYCTKRQYCLVKIEMI